MASWAEQEMRTLSLGDVRRERRVARTLTTLADRPGMSVPQACASKTETNAMYYAWNSEHITPQAILRAHGDATVERIRRHSLVIVANDTTNLEFTQQDSLDGLGHLDAVNQRGLMAHTALAVTPDGIPLGVLHQERWARFPAERGKAEGRKAKPTAEKESQKWLNALQSVQAAVPSTTTAVLTGDREADVYDLFAHPRAAHIELLVRSAQNRQVEHEGQRTRLQEAIRSVSPCGELSIEVPRSDERQARKARLTLRYATVSLLPPKNALHRSSLAPVELQVVLVEEDSPPAGAAPVKWLLLTSLPVSSAEQAMRCVAYYRRRWLIERFHYVLKSGCKIEQLQLHSLDALETALATFNVVAWRLLMLTYLARLTPDAPCDVVFEQAEWEALCIRSSKSSIPPKKPPTLRQAIRMVAQLGGFLGRKNDGEPGVKTLWVGLNALHASTEMYAAMRGIPAPQAIRRRFQER